MKNAIFFDLDGTLLDTAPDLISAANRTIKKFGYPQQDFEKLRPFVSEGSHGILKQVLPVELIEEARVILLEDYQGNISEKTRFFGNLQQTLTTLNEQSITWGIMTNKPRFYSETLMQEMLPWWNAKTLYCSDDFPISKPDPTPLLHIAKELNLNPNEAIYVGDHRKDITAANAANWQSVAVGYGYYLQEDPPHTWNANFYCQTPEQLVQWIQEKTSQWNV